MDRPSADNAATRGVRLLGSADIRALLSRLEKRPTKMLGQNFVHDPNTIRRIVQAAQVAAGDTVLEVGPGLGSLTLGLLEAGARVIAVEIDPVLAAQLPATIADFAPECVGRLTILNADAMRPLTLPIAPDTPLSVVANLPYNVAVPVMLTLLSDLPGLRDGMIMVQAEVAQRLAARPGSRTYGAPSVKFAWYVEASRAGSVPRSVFWPVPNVDSELVRFVRRAPTSPRAGLPPRQAVFAVIDAAFGQRRKMLRAALAPMVGGVPEVTRVLSAAGVEPTARAETLELDAYIRIAATLAER